MTDPIAHPAMLIEEINVLLQENRSLRIELDTLRADLAARNASNGINTDDVFARVMPYSVAEFAKIVRRTPRYISTRCAAGRIKALPGKPFMIPVSELERYLTVK